MLAHYFQRKKIIQFLGTKGATFQYTRSSSILAKRKGLANVFGIKGEFLLNDRILTLQGTWDWLTYSYLFYVLHRYFPEYHNLAKILHQALTERSPESLLNHLAFNMPMLFTGGYEGHYVSLFFIKQHLIAVNRGAHSALSGTVFCKALNSSSLNKHLMSYLLHSPYLKEKDFSRLFKHINKYSPSPTSLTDVERLAKLAKFKPQKAPNCGIANLKPLFYFYHLFSRENSEKKEEEQLLFDSYKFYKCFTFLLRHRIIEDLVDEPDWKATLLACKGKSELKAKLKEYLTRPVTQNDFELSLMDVYA